MAPTIADTSGLIAWFVASDAAHGTLARWMRTGNRQLMVSPYVVAELDYLVGRELGPRAAAAALTELGSGGYVLAGFDRDDLNAALQVIARYPDQAIGITDASLVVLAHRFETRDILTLDHRHFDVLRPIHGGRFRVLPRDWDGTDA